MQRLAIRFTLLSVAIILCYTCVQVYLQAFKFTDDLGNNSKNSKSLKNTPETGVMDKNLLEKLRKEWDDQLEIVKPVQTKNPCQMSKPCANTKLQLGFKMRSGAASVIGPWICVNGVDIMRSSLNNVDRGMNVVVVDGRTGGLVDMGSFDMYGKDSTELIKFIQGVVIPRETAIVFATSYDDAAMRLSEEARDLLRKLQFETVDDLKFRDNFVFVGGVHSKQAFYKIMKHDKEDKYGDWPESIEVEGCMDRI